MSPIANSTDTLSSFVLNGQTGDPNGREFLMTLGLVADTGHGGTPGNDKVGLYVGAEARPGSSDLWDANFLVVRDEGAAPQNVQALEIDLGNNAQDLEGSGFFEAGVNVTGVGRYLSTAGYEVGGNTRANAKAGFHTGLYLAGVQDSDIRVQDDSTAVLLAGGTHQQGINFVNAQIPLAILLAPRQLISWQDPHGYRRLTYDGSALVYGGERNLFRLDDAGNLVVPGRAVVEGVVLGPSGATSRPTISATGADGKQVAFSGSPVFPMQPPASSHAACQGGQVTNDNDYLYVCTGPDHWKRAALSDF